MGKMEDVEIIRGRYRELLEKKGFGSEDSGMWGSNQDFRYEQLAGIGGLSAGAVLEIGCGTGGFLEYLLKHAAMPEENYTGIDLLPEMEEHNALRFPKAHFKTGDLFLKKLDGTWDLVFLCGVFNNRTAESGRYLEELLREAWSYCGGSLCFNFISSYVNYREDEMAYHDPCGVLRFCIEHLSEKVELRHCYSKRDVCVYVHR